MGENIKAETCAFHTITLGQIEDHEERIRTLEKLSVTSHEQIAHLIGKMNDLMGILKAVLGAILGSGLAASVGFIFWYIQSLPR